ncbi:MAG TPA: DUF4234 domain-containing protein [Clostridiaceae bacterium]
MIKQRSLTTLILLSIITCGIYSIYFWYTYNEDINLVCADDNDPNPNYIVVILLSAITCSIYGIISKVIDCRLMHPNTIFPFRKMVKALYCGFY